MKDPFQCLEGTKRGSCTDNYLVKNQKSRLAIATWFGHLKCVMELIEKYNVDINEICFIENFDFGPKNFPNSYCSLSIAIRTKRIDIIRFLISKGIDVNAVIFGNSSSYLMFDYRCKAENINCQRCREEIYYQMGGYGMTPLMFACCMPDCCMNEPDIEIIKFFLDVGANVNRKTIKGCTALHICSALGHLNILKLFIEEYGGNILSIDDFGMTPVLNAALGGEMEIVEYLTNFEKNKSIQISLKDRIDAFDILGATLIQRRSISKGVKYWKKAFEMRYVEGVMVYNKNDIGVSDEFREIETIQQLEKMQCNFLKTQSLVVKERILGPTHTFMFKSILRYMDDNLNDSYHFGMILKFLNHNMNNVILYKKQLSNEYPSFVTYYQVLGDCLRYEIVVRYNHYPITIEDVLLILNLCKTGLLVEIPDPLPPLGKFFSYYIIMLIIYCLSYLFTKCKDNLTTHQWRLVKEILQFCVEKDPRSYFNGKTLLHTACIFSHVDHTMYDRDNIREAILPMIKLLLESGANPCSIDNDGNTALHFIDIFFSNELRKDIANALLSSGAHLDAKNKKRRSCFKNFKNYDYINPLHYTSLQCLASSCIRKHGIPYNEKIYQR